MTRFLFVVLSLLLVFSAFAQTEAPAAPQFGEEIEVRVIDVDVVVVDRQGNPIPNLTREQFELYEDGKRVDITYFSRIENGRLADLPPAAPQPATTAEATAPAPATAAPKTPLTWVVFIDQTSLPPQRRNQAMRQLQLFLGKALAGGDRGVLALNDGRSFRVRQGLTDDPKLLMEQLTKIEKERMAISPTFVRQNAIRNEIRRVESGDMHFEYLAQNQATDISAIIDEEALRTKNAIRAMGALLDTLVRLEGRVALVYVGAGFNSLPAIDLAEVWRARFSGLRSASFAPRPEEHREAIQREITNLYTNLSAQRVTVYTIHGGDPGGGPTSVEDAGQLETDLPSSTDIAALTEAGLAREMAQRTGGLYFKVNQQLASQLETVRRDLSNYYSLGYRPTGAQGKQRGIRIKVNVPGARVRHRQNVRERTANERAAGAVVASMVQQQPQPRVTTKIESRPVPAIPAAVASAANPLGVHVSADRPAPDGWTGDFKLAFDFSIQLDALTFVKRGNAHRADFVMHFALVGKDGAVYPLESREQSLAVPEADLPKGGGNTLTSYSWHVDLAPLKIPEDIPARQDGMRLTVTVEDRSAGTRSVVTVPLGREKEKRG